MGYLVADLARMFTHSKDVKHRGLFHFFGAGCRCTRSRIVYLVSTLSMPPAGDGAGGQPGGIPGEPSGPGG